MNTKNKLGFKYFLGISGMAICLLFTSSCGKLTRYGINSKKIKSFSVKKKINTGYIPVKDLGSGTFLHYAALSGNIVEVKSLLINGDIDVDVQNIYKSSPLHYASENGHVKVVKELLNNGANINEKNKYHSTPLHLASGSNRVKVVKALVNDASIQVNEKDKDKDGCIPFILQ